MSSEIKELETKIKKLKDDVIANSHFPEVVVAISNRIVGLEKRLFFLKESELKTPAKIDFIA
jgi:hypothetical protein